MKAVKDKEKKSNSKFKRRRLSLAGQVLIFSLLATVLTGWVSFFILKDSADRSVDKGRRTMAAELTEDIVRTVKGYPAIDWLFTYWYQHRDTMDVQYNVTEVTKKKASEFSRRNPGLVIDYVTEAEAKALPEEDQKLFAEVVYDTTVGLLNLLKDNYKPAYLSILVTDPNYTQEVFLVSGASPSQKRGPGMNDAFVLGVVMDSTEDQQKGMREAAAGGRSLTRFGDYVDVYGYVQDIMGGWHILVDVVYDVSAMLDQASSQVVGYMGLFVLLQLGLALGLFILTYFNAVRPVDRIQKSVCLYRESKESGKVLDSLSKIRLRNELGELAADVSDMVVSIDQYLEEIQTITTEKEKIAAELGVAKKLQADMLPSSFPAFPDRKEFDLYATMDPAKEVGGDFYDFFLVDENHIGLVIADVSGKGVPAALFMVESMNRIENQANVSRSPGEILSAVNNQLCVGNESGFFVTVWLAIIDLTTGDGVAANGGHEHPVIRRGNGSYELVEYRHSPALGVMEGLPFKEHSFHMEPGDRIYVYTDGVPEATNASDELFGVERMLEALNSHPEDSLEELLPHVKKDIDAFVGDAVQFDDITMLGFDYYGPAGEKKNDE